MAPENRSERVAPSLRLRATTDPSMQLARQVPAFWPMRVSDPTQPPRRRPRKRFRRNARINSRGMGTELLPIVRHFPAKPLQLCRTYERNPQAQSHRARVAAAEALQRDLPDGWRHKISKS